MVTSEDIIYYAAAAAAAAAALVVVSYTWYITQVQLNHRLDFTIT